MHKPKYPQLTVDFQMTMRPNIRVEQKFIQSTNLHVTECPSNEIVVPFYVQVSKLTVFAYWSSFQVDRASIEVTRDSLLTDIPSWQNSWPGRVLQVNTFLVDRFFQLSEIIDSQSFTSRQSFLIDRVFQ